MLSEAKHLIETLRAASAKNLVQAKCFETLRYAQGDNKGCVQQAQSIFVIRSSPPIEGLSTSGMTTDPSAC